MSSAWPMCSEPVTLGGGMTMVNGSSAGRSGRNSPSRSQCAYQRSSMLLGSKVLGSSVMLGPLASLFRHCDPGGCRRPMESALERPTGYPRNLALHMFLDHLRQMLVKPRLE